MASFRDAKLESLYREELNNLIERDLERPVGSLVTITTIDISNGGANAKVGVSVIPEKMTEGVIKNLNGFANELHYKLIRKMNLRTVPFPEFFLDTGAQNAARLEKIVIEHEKEFEAPETIVKRKKIDKKP